MPNRERIKWILLVILAIVPFILAFALPGFSKANAAVSPNPHQMEANAPRTAAGAAADPCRGPYPGPFPYPSPYPGICIYLPGIFTHFSVDVIIDAILPSG